MSPPRFLFSHVWSHLYKSIPTTSENQVTPEYLQKLELTPPPSLSKKAKENANWKSRNTTRYIAIQAIIYQNNDFMIKKKLASYIQLIYMEITQIVRKYEKCNAFSPIILTDRAAPWPHAHLMVSHDTRVSATRGGMGGVVGVEVGGRGGGRRTRVATLILYFRHLFNIFLELC